jgi:hypothetical protein
MAGGSLAINLAEFLGKKLEKTFISSARMEIKVSL